MTADPAAPAQRPPRLLFVHGAGGSAHGWDLQRLAFPGAIVPDLPGHAGGGAGFRWVDAYGEWLHRTAAERGWPPALLVGHSMGGAVALWYALEHPDDLAGVVFVATGARLRVHPELLELLRVDYPRAVERIVERSLAESADRRLCARLQEAMLAVPPDVTLGTLRRAMRLTCLDVSSGFACRRW